MPLGVPRSEETRAAISAGWARRTTPRKGHPLTDSQREALRQANLGKKASAETRAKLSAAKLGRPGPWLGKKRGPMPEEWKAKIAASVPRGRDCHFWGKPPGKVKWTEYRGVKMRGTWEPRFAAAMDRRGIEWEHEPDTFDLGYSTYTPDFKIDGVYWEVKGYLGEKAQRKIATFRSLYPELSLVVVTKPVLQLMEA